MAKKRGYISSINERGFGFVESQGERFFFNVKDVRDLEFNETLVERYVSFVPFHRGSGWGAAEVEAVDN